MSLPELIEPYVTGFVTSDEEALPGLVAQATTLNRVAVRERAVARFDVAAAADRYLGLYQEITAAGTRIAGNSCRTTATAAAWPSAMGGSARHTPRTLRRCIPNATANSHPIPGLMPW